jgi:ligand-binding sensor domain-containing protein
MAADAKGLLWIGSIDGIYFWDGKDKVRSGLTNQEIYAILRDRSGRMWVGGNKGLASSENGIDFKFYGPESGLTARNIRCLADDPHSDCLWVGTDDGGLFILFRFQDETNSGKVSAWQDHVELIHLL